MLWKIWRIIYARNTRDLWSCSAEMTRRVFVCSALKENTGLTTLFQLRRRVERRR
ncbi:hypothetical protein PO909_014462 [Leuciscus waleckii]